MRWSKKHRSLATLWAWSDSTVLKTEAAKRHWWPRPPFHHTPQPYTPYPSFNSMAMEAQIKTRISKRGSPVRQVIISWPRECLARARSLPVGRLQNYQEHSRRKALSHPGQHLGARLNLAHPLLQNTLRYTAPVFWTMAQEPKWRQQRTKSCRRKSGLRSGGIMPSLERFSDVMSLCQNCILRITLWLTGSNSRCRVSASDCVLTDSAGGRRLGDTSPNGAQFAGQWIIVPGCSRLHIGKSVTSTTALPLRIGWNRRMMTRKRERTRKTSWLVK